MQKKKSITKQNDSLQREQEAITNGGRIGGKEAGLRLDVFSHDESA